MRSLFGSAALLLLSAAPPAAAQNPEDYLTQTVCVNGSNVPVFDDPYQGCATGNTARKLAEGEALPYHKVDTSIQAGVPYYQVSDSYPLSSTDGQTRGYQTMYFVNGNNQDPLFATNEPYYYQSLAGFNVIGADNDWVYFRGTGDPGTYWTPWWNANCETTGWRVFPNDSSAFSYGNDTHQLTGQANCTPPATTGTATIEWTQYTGFNFIVSSTDPTKNKVMDTLASYHFARPTGPSGGWGDMELLFFTEEYGVTRWESWRQSMPSLIARQVMNDRCPRIPALPRDDPQTDSFHGSTYYLHDCRNWTTLIDPASSGLPSWDPDGFAAGSQVRRWGVDPLYTGTNYLSNTHQGPTCSDTNWATVNTPNPVTLGTVAGAPWQDWNCVRTLEVSSVPPGAYYQLISAPPIGAPYRYGITLWKYDPATSTPTNLNVAIIQRDSSGNLVGQDVLVAPVINTPRWFEGTFTRAATAATVIFALYPEVANTEYAATGAYITR